MPHPAVTPVLLRSYAILLAAFAFAAPTLAQTSDFDQAPTLSSAAPVGTPTPNSFSFQGTISENEPLIAGGTHAITVRPFDHPTGGAPLFERTYLSVTTAGGALVALVGQVEARLGGPAEVGDLLVASGHGDGRARAVALADYDPQSDEAVLGRVLRLTEAGDAVALVGVDEAAALRDVVSRQAADLRDLRDDRDRQAAQIEALAERLARLEARPTPSI